MITKQLALVACAVMVLSIGGAYAGPCNTGGKDAGSGPTPGSTGQSTTTGSANTGEHPPTDTMNRVAGQKATSSQDTQRQQQGQPTAALAFMSFNDALTQVVLNTVDPARLFLINCKPPKLQP